MSEPRPRPEGQITWAKGWTPERVQAILNENPYRVGFKSHSSHVRSLALGSVVRRRVDSARHPRACSSSAVHLAWWPHHASQEHFSRFLYLAVLNDPYPGTHDPRLRPTAKMFGTKYTVVAVAPFGTPYARERGDSPTLTFSSSIPRWWRSGRVEGLAWFGLKQPKGFKIKSQAYGDKPR